VRRTACSFPAVWFLAVLLVAAGWAAPAAAAGTERAPVRVAYGPPVAAPVVDPFRPPPAPWGAGNRGIEYATEPGTPVVAAAAGEVVFAGAVAGSRHVVVLHADGLRTSYSFLAGIAVRRGRVVRAGEVLGTAGSRVHFGARAGDTYIDPASLFAGTAQVWLVPEEARRPGTEAAERAGLARFLRGLGRAGAAAVAWARGAAVTAAGHAADRARTVATAGVDLVASLPPVDPVGDLALALAAWRVRAADCTPESAPAPRVRGRRILVLVAGLGSATGAGGDPRAAGAVSRFDAAAAGYRRADVVQFSYRGGTTADRPYGPADTQVDIAVSAGRLRALLEGLAAANPGVPIDVVAHSQGGLVARAALTGAHPPPVATLVTLATPHRGAPLATALARIPRRGAPGAGIEALRRLRPLGLDPEAASIAQMAAGSAFLDGLGPSAPTGVRTVSIAARGDLVVPAPAAALAGAVNVVVPVDGPGAHADLPADPSVAREVALAVAGAPPTCEPLADVVADVLTTAAVHRMEVAVAAALPLST
jgi:murein DD-endopeptidase MepM/ murein hydrolase activator NlpD